MPERPTPDRPFEITPTPPAGGSAWSEKPEDKPYEERIKIPKDLEIFREEAEQFIRDHTELFYTIARDRSLRFTVGNGFYINLQEGEVCLDIRFMKWGKELGLSKLQIVWAVCHELRHFRDLMENPKGMMKNYEYLENRAKELAPEVLEIVKIKFNGTIPPHLVREIPIGRDQKRTMRFIEWFIYRQLHRLYNALDDRYINPPIGLSAAIFGKGGSQETEVERLYRDYLFPTNPRKRGEPPRELEAADYEGIPKSAQLADYLLRRRMVPGQSMLVSPEVRAALSGHADKTAERLGMNLEKEVGRFTDYANTRARDPAWRYERIKSALEPVWVKLFLQDLREKEPPQKGEKGEGEGEPGEPQEGEGEPGEPNIWDTPEGNPEPIDLDTIKDFINQQKEKEKKDSKKKREDDRHARLTPNERADKAQLDSDKKLAEKNDVDTRNVSEYRTIERSIDPYKRDLANVFEQLMNTIAERIRRVWEEAYRSGRFNTERFIRKYGHLLAAGAPEHIPWEALDTYDQQEFLSRLTLFPDKIRVRLVLDGSGSMDENKLLALKQVCVLFLEALSTFEATVNLRFKLKNSFQVDTEIWMYGDDGVRVKSFAATKITPEQEIADRFRAFGEINSSYGGTSDCRPFQRIEAALTPAQIDELKKGKAKDLALEVTDGGSFTAQETRDVLRRLEKLGMISRGFQVGEVSDDDKQKFDFIWGKDGERIEHPKDLPSACAKLLAGEILKTKIMLQYQGEVEEEEEEEG